MLPLTFCELSERMKYTQKPQSYRRSGQYKLYLDLCLFAKLTFKKNEMNIVLYIGSAPGNNINYFLNECKSNGLKVFMYLYDTQDHVKELYNRNDCVIHNKYMTKEEALKYCDIKNILLFSDIRTIDERAKEPTTKNILFDNKIQNDVIEIVKPKFSMLKYRLPFPDDYNGELIRYPLGIEYLQTDSGWSNERRLFVDNYIKFHEFTVNLDDPDNELIVSEEKMMAYNNAINENIKQMFLIGKYHVNNFRQLIGKVEFKTDEEYYRFRMFFIKNIAE